MSAQTVLEIVTIICTTVLTITTMLIRANVIGLNKKVEGLEGVIQKLHTTIRTQSAMLRGDDRSIAPIEAMERNTDTRYKLP